MKPKMTFAVAVTLGAGALAAATTSILWGWPDAHAAGGAAAAAKALPEGELGWGLIGAALATGLAALGAGIAVANVGAAAIGAVAEKPELLGRMLIFVGLAEGIAIYGLIVSILILNRLG